MTPAAGLVDAYDISADAWTRGPERVYEAMAEALIDAAGVPIAGARVLDVGAGTGTASRAARRAGATLIVGIDVSPMMLRAGRGWDVAIVADALAMPFAHGCFDVAAAAFSIGHLDDPIAGLTETRRVARSLAASAFLTGWTHPAKAVVDATAGNFGFSLPEWYRILKSGPEEAVDDPDRLTAAAVAAGYGKVDVTVHEVDVGLRTPEQVSAWRLGMAHLAPFVATLDPERQRDLHAACSEALIGMPPVVVPMVVLAATA